MPNLEKQFKDFLDKISLSPTQKESLRRSRDNDRSNIIKHFKDKLEKSPPKFHMQGSFAMGTPINPLNGEYDLDDGVYLQNLDSDFSKWETPVTVHKWVSDALSDITSDGVYDKPTCVRLIYRGNYHIDFPIYGIYGNNQYLAHKTEGWIPSYPKELTEWFRNKVKDAPQIENLVKYIKAWKDYTQNTIKLPSGMVLTILVVNNYVPDDEDQYAFLETCKNIHSSLSYSFSLSRPVSPYENLLKGYSDTRRNEFLSKLKTLIDYGTNAASLEQDSLVKASEYWQRVFGDRFPKAEEPKQTKSAAIIGSHGKSA